MTADLRRIQEFKAGAKWKGYEMGPAVNRGRLKVGSNRVLQIPGNFSVLNYAWYDVKDVIFYEPFILRYPATLDSIYMEVTTAGSAGALAKTSIYRANIGWEPGALVSAPVATMSVASTGVKSITGLGLALTPGLYFKAYKHNSAVDPVTRKTRAGALYDSLTDPNATPFIDVWRVAQTYATAWSDPGLAIAITYGTPEPYTHSLFLDFSAV